MHIEHLDFERDDLSIEQMGTLGLLEKKLEHISLERQSPYESDLTCWVTASVSKSQNNGVLILQFWVHFNNSALGKHLGPSLPVNRSSFYDLGWTTFPFFELIKELFSIKYPGRFVRETTAA